MNVIDFGFGRKGSDIGLRRTRPTWGTIRANLRLLYYKLVLWRKNPPSRCVEQETDYYSEPACIARYYPFPDMSERRFDENIHLSAEQALDKLALQYETDYRDYMI